MTMLTGAFYIIAILFFTIAILIATPVIPGDDAKPWRGLPVLFGFLFLTAAEFLARGGMPG